MMDFDERLGWLLLGCAIGFVLGYIVRSLREIKEELHEVDAHVKKLDDIDTPERKEEEVNENKIRNERGFVGRLGFKDFLLFLVVAMTVWGSIASQKASNEVAEAQADVKVQASQIAIAAACNQEFLAKTIVALNERATFSVAQATANVKLQQGFADFLEVLLTQPPKTTEEQLAALKKYFGKLNVFVEVSGNTKDALLKNPFPTIEDLGTCLSEKSATLDDH